MIRELGWHSVGDVPHVVAYGGDPKWLRESTARHEATHHGLTYASIHGQVQVAVQDLQSRLTGDPRAEVAEQLAVTMHRTSDTVHEATATMAELLELHAVGRDELQQRFDGLPFSYRMAAGMFERLAYNPANGMAASLRARFVEAVGGACMNTLLLESASQKGLLAVLTDGFDSDLDLSPNHRFERIAELTVHRCEELILHVQGTLERIHSAPADVWPLIVDRAVESWIKANQIFPVGVRIGHAHRCQLLERLIVELEATFGLEHRAIRFGIQRHVPVRERVHHKSPRELDGLSTYWEMSGDYKTFMELAAQSNPSVFIFSLTEGRRFARPEMHYCLVLTAIAIAQESLDSTPMLDPECFVNTYAGFEFGAPKSFDFSEFNVVVRVETLAELGPTGQNELLNQFNTVFVHVPSYSREYLDSIQRRWGPITRMRTYSHADLGPKIVVFDCRDLPAPLVLLMSDYGHNDLQIYMDILDESVEMMPEEDLPAMLCAYLWPILYGIFAM